MPGRIVISLDFELIWGIFDHCRIEDKISYFDNTRQTIPRILDIFTAHQIQATWATVGMLFCSDWDDWQSSCPTILPKYHNSKLDPYEFGRSHQRSNWSRFFFAPDLIRLIATAPGQELGSHTFSHYYCLEPGQNAESFAADLEAAKRVAARFGVCLKSLVFPRNQFRSDYVEICRTHGLSALRTNPPCWYWRNPKGGLLHRWMRTADAYLPLKRKSYPDSLMTKLGRLSQQPASRFLRPLSGNRLLDLARLKRVIWELRAAAVNNETYHLWWHPHNFGDFPEASLGHLETIASEICRLRNEFGLLSMTMGEISGNSRLGESKS